MKIRDLGLPLVSVHPIESSSTAGVVQSASL
jgi:hypothetical protein